MIKVDANKCIGCGLCANMCTDVFKMNSENISEVISQKNIKCAKLAVDACPVKAILIV
jgi:ferredoxin